MMPLLPLRPRAWLLCRDVANDRLIQPCCSTLSWISCFSFAASSSWACKSLIWAKSLVDWNRKTNVVILFCKSMLRDLASGKPKKKKNVRNLGHSCLVLLHQLVYVLLVLLQTWLQVVLFPLQSADLLLQLKCTQRKRDFSRIHDIHPLEYKIFKVICKAGTYRKVIF